MNEHFPQKAHDMFELYVDMYFYIKHISKTGEAENLAKEYLNSIRVCLVPKVETFTVDQEKAFEAAVTHYHGTNDNPWNGGQKRKKLCEPAKTS